MCPNQSFLMLCFSSSKIRHRECGNLSDHVLCKLLLLRPVMSISKRFDKNSGVADALLVEVFVEIFNV